MSNSLNVAAISIDTHWGAPADNLAILGRCLDILDPETDLVVVPELFSTGFASDPDALAELAESNGGGTIHTVMQLARRYNTAIAGSFIARSGNHIYNRGFFIEPSGEETFYDKRHLFNLSPESRLFTAGDSPMPVIRFRGWNIAMIICYDLRFPVWSRNRGNGYDMLVVPANWPNARAYAWEHLLIARAIENQAYVVGCNRSGSDDHGTYDQATYIIDPMGQPVGQRRSPRSAPAPLTVATAQMQQVEDARRRLPVAAAADDFTLLCPSEKE